LRSFNLAFRVPGRRVIVLGGREVAAYWVDSAQRLHFCSEPVVPADPCFRSPLFDDCSARPATGCQVVPGSLRIIPNRAFVAGELSLPARRPVRWGPRLGHRGVASRAALAPVGPVSHGDAGPRPAGMAQSLPRSRPPVVEEIRRPATHTLTTVTANESESTTGRGHRGRKWGTKVMRSVGGDQRGPRSRLEPMGREVLIVHLAGGFELRELTQRLLERDALPPHLVLDMIRVPQIDGEMMAELAGTRDQLLPRGTALMLWRLRTQPERRMRDSPGFQVIHILDEALPVPGEQSCDIPVVPAAPNGVRHLPASAPAHGQEASDRADGAMA
jgi:hypothetical protein